MKFLALYIYLSKQCSAYTPHVNVYTNDFRASIQYDFNWAFDVLIGIRTPDLCALSINASWKIETSSLLNTAEVAASMSDVAQEQATYHSVAC